MSEREHAAPTGPIICLPICYKHDAPTALNRFCAPAKQVQSAGLFSSR